MIHAICILGVYRVCQFIAAVPLSHDRGPMGSALYIRLKMGRGLTFKIAILCITISILGVCDCGLRTLY